MIIGELMRRLGKLWKDSQYSSTWITTPPLPRVLVHSVFGCLRILRVLYVTCGFRLNLHNRRDAEDAEVAQRLESEPAPFRAHS